MVNPGEHARVPPHSLWTPFYIDAPPVKTSLNELIHGFRREVAVSDYGEVQAVLTGNLIRDTINKKVPAPNWFNLRVKKPILYITGGSQGSEIINSTVSQVLPQLLKEWIVIHQCGPKSAQRNYVKELHEQEKMLTQAKQNQGKSSALTGAGLSSGMSSAETDMMYSNMQSQMNAMSGGMVMRNAVQDGDAGTLMRGAHYSAEKQMGSSIARVEELEASTGSIEAAMATSVTAGRVAGIGEARSDVGTATGYNALADKSSYGQGIENQAASKVAGTASSGANQTVEQAMGVASLQAKMKTEADNTDLGLYTIMIREISK